MCLALHIYILKKYICLEFFLKFTRFLLLVCLKVLNWADITTGSGGTVACHHLQGVCSQHLAVMSRGAAEQPTVHEAAPQTKIHPAQDVRVKYENPMNSGFAFGFAFLRALP